MLILWAQWQDANKIFWHLISKPIWSYSVLCFACGNKLQIENQVMIYQKISYILRINGEHEWCNTMKFVNVNIAQAVYNTLSPW